MERNTKITEERRDNTLSHKYLQDNLVCKNLSDQFTACKIIMNLLHIILWLTKTSDHKVIRIYTLYTVKIKSPTLPVTTNTKEN